MPTYIKQSISHFLVVVLLDNKGDFKLGETITYEVRKSSDNSLTTSGTLTNTGDIYIDTISISVLGEYYVLYFTPSKIENGLETLIVQANTVDDIQDSLDALGIKLCQVLGLVQSNYRLNNLVYNTDGCLTSGKISIYPTAGDVDAETNAISTYTITGVYNTETQVIDYKVKED